MVLVRSSSIRLLGIVGLLSLTLMAVAGGASAAPVPPFIQCPPVGLDTSCGILIVYNPDGTRITLADPSQPPFDGIEDTLVGVQNNSSSSIASTALTAPHALARLAPRHVRMILANPPHIITDRARH